MKRLVRPPPAPRRPIPEPYFIVLGTIAPRKNYMLLLNLWQRMVDELGQHVLCLDVIGQRGWECEQMVDAFIESLGARG